MIMLTICAGIDFELLTSMVMTHGGLPSEQFLFPEASAFGSPASRVFADKNGLYSTFSTAGGARKNFDTQQDALLNPDNRQYMSSERYSKVLVWMF
jgi:hypothetical protein